VAASDETAVVISDPPCGPNVDARGQSTVGAERSAGTAGRSAGSAVLRVTAATFGPHGAWGRVGQ
jgi:hypothetical protein